jgi:hypothetical protein
MQYGSCFKQQWFLCLDYFQIQTTKRSRNGNSIEKSLSLFYEMRDFGLTTDRSHEVVAKIYEASKKARISPLNTQSGVQNDWTWAEDQFWPLQEDMDWFSFPEFGGVTFDTEFLAGANNQGSH